MSNYFCLDKMSLVVTTRCNLKCKLCDEFIPQNKPFPDMTINEERKLLEALFRVVDKIKLLHLSGGGEPFLNSTLGAMIDVAFEYEDKFDQLMVFTNSTIKMSDELLAAICRHKDKIIIHASDYAIMPERAMQLYALLRANGINLRVIKYHGEHQDYNGWVDFGGWEAKNRTPDDLNMVFRNCGITKYMNGNWRTRDGKVHWCQRSQRGMELGILPDNPDDYVDLYSNESSEEKRAKFLAIAQNYLSACDHCSGDHGTSDVIKRFSAGKQLE